MYLSTYLKTCKSCCKKACKNVENGYKLYLAILQSLVTKFVLQIPQLKLQFYKVCGNLFRNATSLKIKKKNKRVTNVHLREQPHANRLSKKFLFISCSCNIKQSYSKS